MNWFRWNTAECITLHLATQCVYLTVMAVTVVTVILINFNITGMVVCSYFVLLSHALISKSPAIQLTPQVTCA